MMNSNLPRKALILAAAFDFGLQGDEVFSERKTRYGEWEYGLTRDGKSVFQFCDFRRSSFKIEPGHQALLWHTVKVTTPDHVRFKRALHILECEPDFTLHYPLGSSLWMMNDLTQHEQLEAWLAYKERLEELNANMTGDTP